MGEIINVQELFGENVFNDKVMLEKLPKKVYKELHKTIDDGKELDPMIWQSQTAEICRKTCELDVFREATDIYCYIDFGGEVGTRPLMLEAWKLGKTVWVPKVHGETMDFYEITSFDEL